MLIHIMLPPSHGSAKQHGLVTHSIWSCQRGKTRLMTGGVQSGIIHGPSLRGLMTVRLVSWQDGGVWPC